MYNIPKVIDLVVNNDLCIGCGMCTYKCPNNALEMQCNEFGFLVPVLNGNCETDGSCLAVCPFNPKPDDEVRTENELSDIYLKDATLFHPKVGKYEGIYAGYTEEFRATSSSGGIATFIMTDLLERGIVNHIFSVKESKTPGIHYEYAVSNNRQELLASSKTRYYPVTLANVFSKIDELEGKVAIVGIACFIKSIRLAQHTDQILKEKIPFLVGIICGGIKSRFFTEYLADKVGVSKEFYYKPEYRIKDLNSSAIDYSFGCISMNDNQNKTVKMQTLGDMWGTGLFKANACDFCDDVTNELADISLGDAWVNPYDQDGGGTNVIVTRTILADNLIQDGIKTGRLHIDNLQIEHFIKSQQGNFNHRHIGLSARLKQAKMKKIPIPPKRFGNEKVSLDFKIVQKIRMKLRSASLNIWRSNNNAISFDKKISKYRTLLAYATRIYHFRRKHSKK